MIQRLASRLRRRAERPAARPLAAEVSALVRRLPQSHQEAAQGLVDHPACRSRDYLDKVVRVPREGAHPALVMFYLAFNEQLRARGYPFFAHELLRSDARQAVLWDQGVTRARPGSSAHNFGCAVDIVHATRFWDLSRLEWAVVGAIGKEVARKRHLRLTWGGDWAFYDPAHWELTDWREYRDALERVEREGLELSDDTAMRFEQLDQLRKAAA